MGVVDDLVDDPAEVGVVAGDDAHDEVADAGDRVDLEHLGDRRQVRDDGRVALPLADLEGAERRDRVAERSGIHLGAKDLMTPRSWSRSSRACTVPRATPRVREAPSTPTWGSSVNRAMSRASRASTPVWRVMVTLSGPHPR